MRKPLIIARQGGRPSGLLGQIVVRVMAKETVAENDLVLELLQLAPADSVLEIGCGHGDTLAKAARVAREGVLAGIDFSWLTHRHAVRRHRALVAGGRLDFRFGSSDQLPFAAESFNKAYAVHTIYFWTAPLDHLREARRVLRPDGRFVLGFRPAEDPGFRATYPAEVYRIRPQAEVVELIGAAGFRVLDVIERMVATKRMTFVVATAA
jgi:ubiquinone/menaquinone biosynthesis C-methylase UbiE